MSAYGSNLGLYNEISTTIKDETDLIFQSLSAIKSNKNPEEIEAIVEKILFSCGNDTNKLKSKIEQISSCFEMFDPKELNYGDQKVQKLFEKISEDQFKALCAHKEVIIEQFKNDAQELIAKFEKFNECGIPETPNPKSTDLSAGKETKRDVHPNKIKSIIKPEPQQTMTNDLRTKLDDYYTEYEKVKTMSKMNPQTILMRKNLKKLRKNCANQMIKERLTPPRENGVVTQAVEGLIQEMAQLCCDQNKGLGSVERLGGRTGSAFVIKAGSGEGSTNLFVFKPTDLQSGGKMWKDSDDEDVNNYFGGAKGVEVRDYIRATSPFSTHVATIATLPGLQFGLRDENCKGLLIDFPPNVGSIQDLTGYGLARGPEVVETVKEKLKKLGLPDYEGGRFNLTGFENWLRKIPLSKNGKKNLILHYFGAVYYSSTDENPSNFFLQKDGKKEYQLSFIDGGKSMSVGHAVMLVVRHSHILRYAGDLIREEGIREDIEEFLRTINIEDLLKSDLEKLQKHGVHEKNSAEIQRIESDCREAWKKIVQYLDDRNEPLPQFGLWY